MTESRALPKQQPTKTDSPGAANADSLPSFKVGDRVRVSKGPATIEVYGGAVGTVEVGCIFEVWRIQGVQVGVKTTWDAQEIKGWLPRDCLEPAPSAKTP